MKRTWKNFKIDKNKVYQFIGQAVVYSSLYIGSIAFGYWMFLQRINLLGGSMKDKGLNLIDKIELLISDFIDYDNEHHCFQWFVLGFSICTLLMNTVVLILKLKQ